MTGLNICSGRDRLIMIVLSIVSSTIAVLLIVCLRWSAEGLFVIPIVMTGVMRIANRVIVDDHDDALEADFFNPPRPSRFFIMKAGPIEGAPFRAWSPPLNVGEVIGWID